MRSTLERHCRRGREATSPNRYLFQYMLKASRWESTKSTVITKDNSVASTFHEIFSTDPGAPLLVSY